ncbi:MAG TPA: hypothetical protein VHQ97_06735 [Solirubrobacterales bacterium]|jgi:hypothetical protein|nr:hypothetical protein [Solirubrobacterales bacterium]
MEAATVRGAPARVTAPSPKRAPAKRAPARRRRPAPVRRPGGQLIPIAVNTASAVGRLPDSGLVVRMTRGRAWIGVLGVLLAGIVALNVITLSFAASAGHIDQNVQALDRENSILRSHDAQLSATERVRGEAATLGLAASTAEDVGYVQAGPDDVRVAAERLAAAGTG